MTCQNCGTEEVFTVVSTANGSVRVCEECFNRFNEETETFENNEEQE